MKKTIFIAVLAMITSTAGMGQHAAMSGEYWVVENHTRDSVYSIVRFYDANNALMHEVKIDNLTVDIRQKKQRKHLDQLLNDYKTRTSRGLKKIRSKTSV
ncbi:hypothetical protein WBG78_13365 [Chryseolinea sp. T2]|uniref:hypothetical protein n=1 Tax=Chryseolinea sp. T2 TaxID=3129255 RepID=UPI003077FFAA